MSEPEQCSHFGSVDQIFGIDLRRHALIMRQLAEVCYDYIRNQLDDGPGGALTPRGLAGTYREVRHGSAYCRQRPAFALRLMRGHIHKRVRTCKNGRKSVLWYVVVDLPRGADGKPRGFDTRKAAEAARARFVHELTTGFYVEPSRMRLDEWLVDHWLPVTKTRVKPTTYNAYRTAITHHISPTEVWNSAS
jgi:hypothetical protein